MDPIVILLLIVVAYLVSELASKAIDAWQNHRRGLADKAHGPQPVCGCDDHYAFHDPKTGHCHAMRRVPAKWDPTGYPISYRDEQCGCRQYVGPQPLETYYATEVTDASAYRPRLDKPEED